MKRIISSALVMSILASNIAMAQVQVGSDIQNAHPTTVVDKRTGKTIEAIAGLKKEPTTGKMVKYRTFTDPQNGDIIEQYLEGKDDNGKDMIREIRSKRSVTKETKVITEVKKETSSSSSSRTANNSSSAPAAKLSNDDKTMKYIIIGAAVVAVVGVAVGARAIYKSGKRSQLRERAREDDAFNRGAQAARNERPSALADMPTKITLGSDVPTGSGRSVNVAGAVPTSSVPASVPRFRTAGGDTYIVQQNPNNGLLETILLYDMLTSPYYYGYRGAYNYGMNFGYSPFGYGNGGAVVYNETIINNGDHAQWSDHNQVQDHSSTVNDSYVQTAETVTTTRDQVVSDVTEPASQSDFSSSSDSYSAPRSEPVSDTTGSSSDFSSGSDSGSSFGGSDSGSSFGGSDSGSSFGGSDSGSSFGGGDSGGGGGW